MIPMPILLLLSNFLGQPVMVIITPGELPQYQIQVPAKPINKSEVESSGCPYVVCKA